MRFPCSELLSSVRLTGIWCRFNVEAYLAVHGPALGVTAAAAAEANGTGAPAAAVVKIHMAGDDDEAKEKARREREVEEKRAQNALPSWIAQSTISADPEQTFGSTGSAAASSSGSPAPGATAKPATSQPLRMLGEEAKPVVAAGAADEDEEEEEEIDLDAYYANLELAQPSGDSTAASTPALAPQVDSPALSPSVSVSGREGSEQISSFNSPAPLKREREDEGEGDDSGASAKRAKQDDTPATASPAVPSVTATPEAPVVNGEAAEDEEDEDEFDEFEPAEGGNADPNQLVSVGGNMLPFSQVTDEMTGDMVRVVDFHPLRLSSLLTLRYSRRLRTSTACVSSAIPQTNFLLATDALSLFCRRTGRFTRQSTARHSGSFPSTPCCCNRISSQTFAPASRSSQACLSLAQRSVDRKSVVADERRK